MKAAPWWWKAAGLPTGEEEEENGEDGEEENGDNGDNGDNGLHGGRPGDPNGDNGGQVPFDRNLEALGRGSLARERLQAQWAAEALRRSQSR